MWLWVMVGTPRHSGKSFELNGDLMKLSFLVELEFSGDPHAGDVQNRLYGAIEMARQNSLLCDELDEEVSCDDVEVNLQ